MWGAWDRAGRRRSGRLLWALGLVLVVQLVRVSPDGGVSSAQSPGAGAEAAAALRGNPPRSLELAPYVSLPANGGTATDVAAQVTLDGLGLLDLPGVSVSGGSDGPGQASAAATTSAFRVDLFGGRVRADNLRASVSASSVGGEASADGDVSLERLEIDGDPIPAPALNQQIALPGIGTLIVRELIIDRSAPGAARAVARALRVIPDPAASVMQGAELIVGSASAGVPGVPLSPPLARAFPARSPLPTLAPLPTRLPLDLTSDDNDNDGFDESENESNDNEIDDNVARVTPGGGGGSAATVRPVTSTPVVVTVVVVVQTATPQATATSTPQATATPTPQPTATHTPAATPTNRPR